MEIEDSLIFVHDASKCVEESDDPIKNVVYFSQEDRVSDDQKSQLCNGLVALSASIRGLSGRYPSYLESEKYLFALHNCHDITVCFGIRKTQKPAKESIRSSLHLLITMIKMRYSCIRRMLEIWEKVGCQDNLLGIIGIANQQTVLHLPFDIQMQCHLFVEHIVQQFCPLASCLITYACNHVIYTSLSSHLNRAITSLVHFMDHRSHKVRRNLSLQSSFPVFLSKDLQQKEFAVNNAYYDRSVKNSAIFPGKQGEEELKYECQVAMTVLSNRSCTLYIISEDFHNITEHHLKQWEESLNNLGALISKSY